MQQDYCFNCMKPIVEETPIEVYVSRDFCHSSYWQNDEKKYGYLDKDGEHGYLYLHKNCAADENDYSNPFGEGYEVCDGCGVTFHSDDMNMNDYEESGNVNCPKCQSLEGSVLKYEDFPLDPEGKIGAHVFQDYDALDDLAKQDGYLSPDDDETGLDLSGWIPTMGDSSHSVEGAIQSLNNKVETAHAQGLDVIVGFCQTGLFSVGYSIYTKAKSD